MNVPSKSREVISFGTAESGQEIGLKFVLVARSAKGICAVLLGGNEAALVADLHRRFRKATLVPGGAELAETTAAVARWLEAPRGAFPFPLDLRGTPFQQAVWAALLAIPEGTTVSYTEVARRAGQPHAVRAVAQAIGANPVAVAVPCHRVIGADGSLGGYRWGVECKRLLLAREARKPSVSLSH